MVRLIGNWFFYRDSETRFVGYSWDTTDERMMQKTWSIGKKNFANFLDLKMVAEKLGFRGYGLAALAEKVLKAGLSKSDRIIKSDWAAKKLTRPQCVYAALDAFVAGHMFRILRQWHDRPQPCLVCGCNLGEELQLSYTPSKQCRLLCSLEFGLQACHAQ